jgi:hypothetical protein
MTSRLKLHDELCSILGSRYVYFQPPSSKKMEYPAIVYSLKTIETNHANNGVYHSQAAYELTLIDKNPDSVYIIPILRLPTCKFDRFYTADNLNHWTFTIYY